jgi:protein TilB
LETITEVLGTTCRKLKILYLQNNIIAKMENLHHMKELEYLNLALNNIDKIQGLDRCEFLNKLDMTVNFVDFDELEESITCLSKRPHLRELYMMGNPCQMDWEEGFENYVIHRIPQLHSLDGKDITKSMRLNIRGWEREREIPSIFLFSSFIFHFLMVALSHIYSIIS